MLLDRSRKFIANIVCILDNSAIPVFGGLVGLIGALLGSILCLAMESSMWFYDFFSLRKTDKSFKYRALFAWAAVVGFCGIFICGAGTYGAVMDIKLAYAANGGTTPWSCESRKRTHVTRTLY